MLQIHNFEKKQVRPYALCHPETSEMSLYTTASVRNKADYTLHMASFWDNAVKNSQAASFTDSAGEPIHTASS